MSIEQFNLMPVCAALTLVGDKFIKTIKVE